MKIVIFDINRLSFEGGAEKYLTEIGEAFGEKGNEVLFIGDCRFLMRLFIWSGVLLLVNPFWKLPKLFYELKKVPPMNENSKKYIAYFSLKLKSLIPFSIERRKVQQFLNEADVVYIKNEIFEVIFFWLLNIRNKNQYLMIFSSLNYPFPKSFRAKVHNLVYLSKFYKFLVKKIGKVIVSNRADEEYFVKTIGLQGKSVHCIPYGLEKDYFIKPKEIKLTSGFKILFVARMEEQKGINDLKQIIEVINKDNLEDVKFIIAGSGPLEEIPRQLEGKFNNVDYKGQLSSSDVRKCYLLSDLVIITSKWETFSYVCLEAQACGCPVVSFDIPGPRDILSITKGGKLVCAGNIQNICKTIISYLNLKKINLQKYLAMRNKISINSYKYFSITRSVEKLSSL